VCASILCTWTKVLPNEEVHFSFLRSDPRQASPSLRLYHSAWSGERALRSCAWSDDAAVIQNYFSLCRERTHEFSDHPDGKLDVDSMLETEELCGSVAALGDGGRPRPARSVGGHHQGPAERSEVRSHQRVKRGFIVPGTLWCGSGNKAPSYADLGVFAETDSCCREHDQCKHTILSFHSEFGVFNSNIFTMSHCDCDNKFRSCLMEAKDSISNVVGYTFFNLLKMHCFELSHKLQCKERNWFGMCKETQMALYAEVYPPTVYESPDPTEASMNTTRQTPSLLLLLQHSQSLHRQRVPPLPPSLPLPTLPPPRHRDSPDQLRTIWRTLYRPKNKLSLSWISQVFNTSLLYISLYFYITAMQLNIIRKLHFPSTEKELSCAVYKDLDECRNKILPQRKRYGLHNPDDRTLYHCNCTTSCTSVVVKAELPRLEQSSRADMEEQRHLQAVQLKVRRPNTRRAKRRDRAVRLHKLCLRMVRPKLNQNKTRTHGQGAHQPAV
uniref:phospholipase A2 n=1 Tax=Sander lucioperca TaxID=283035 RepID=A0A8D0D702_SANLU